MNNPLGDPLQSVPEGLVIRNQDQAVERREPTPMDLMERAIALGPEGVAMLKELTALKIQMEDRSAKTEYIAAMSRLAPLLPIVDRKGHVSYEGKEGKQGMDRRYAKYEDIDEAIRGIYSAEGFSVSWNTAEGPGGKIRVIGTCSHRMGHSEMRQLDLPHDSSGGKNAIQAIGSTVAYGKRLITVMIFNVRVKGEDTDGNDPTPIAPEQVSHLEKLMKETDTKPEPFRVITGVPELKDIPKRDYLRVKNALETKARSKGVKS